NIQRVEIVRRTPYRLATVVIRSCGPRPRRTTSLADGRGGGSRIRQRDGGRRGRGHGREQLIVGVVRGDAGARAACRAASRVGGGQRADRVIEATDHVLPGARGSRADAGVGALSMTPAGIPGGPRLLNVPQRVSSLAVATTPVRR